MLGLIGGRERCRSPAGPSVSQGLQTDSAKGQWKEVSESGLRIQQASLQWFRNKSPALLCVYKHMLGDQLAPLNLLLERKLSLQRGLLCALSQVGKGGDETHPSGFPEAP